MTNSFKTIGIELLAAILLAATGCDVYRIETVLNSDGSVDRAIYQPAEGTPNVAQNAVLWKQITYAPPPDASEKAGWSGLIRDLPLKGPDKDRPYFAAWGHFPSQDRVPDHVEFSAPEGSKVPAGKMARIYQCSDFLFVVRHRWRETLTDVVTLSDMRKARDELADLALKVGEDIFNEAVGPEFDSSGLFKWLRSEGTTVMAEFTDARFVQYTARKGKQGDDALKEEFADILARHGLALKIHGKWLDDKALQEAVEGFCVGRIMNGVRDKKTGAPVPKEMATIWFREILKENGNKGEQTRFAKAADKVIETKYQGQKAFHDRIANIQVRVTGLYRGSVILPQQGIHAFHCTLTMPGTIVEANGQLLGANRARWKFGAEEAYPLGYEMSCTSLEPLVQNQDSFLHGRFLVDQERMQEFVDEVQNNEKLISAFEECRKQKSMAPLYELRKEKVDIDRLLKLLKLPSAPG